MGGDCNEYHDNLKSWDRHARENIADQDQMLQNVCTQVLQLLDCPTGVKLACSKF